jgi:peptidoglycan/LPS O-acetylase OafA/YrhL
MHRSAGGPLLAEAVARRIGVEQRVRRVRSCPMGTSSHARARNRSLDGLRGLAVVLVVLAHASLPGFHNGGTTGVTLFFALSGFLITSLLLEERFRNGAISLGRFYMRRLLRLMPALLAMVAVVTVAEVVRHTPKALTHALLTVTYLTDFVRAGGGTVGFLDHTWSLSVEEHFYLIWPLLLILVTARARNPRMAVALLALAGAVASIVIRYLLLHAVVGHVTNDPRVEFAFDTRCDAIFAGCMVAALVTPATSPSRNWRLGAIVSAIVLAALTASHLYVYALTPCTIVCGVLVPYVWARPIPVLSSDVAVWLGRRSYAIYLWHVPMFYFMSGHISPGPLYTVIGLFVIAPASIVIAALSYRFVERPALRLKQRFESVSLLVSADERDDDEAEAHAAPVTAAPDLIGTTTE